MLSELLAVQSKQKSSRQKKPRLAGPDETIYKTNADIDDRDKLIGCLAGS